MTPAARVQAAAEVLDRITDGTAAEAALTGWARSARYAGSGDRAAVRDHVFDVLRRRRSCAALGGGETGRALMLGLLRAQATAPETLFTGTGHGPAALTAPEAAAGRPPDEGPEALDMPEWLWPLLRSSLGAQAEHCARALRQRAPVMLRVNTRRATVAQAMTLLAQDDIATTPHPIAATALHVQHGARRVARSRAYADGWVELQDGSSQAAMETLDPAPGARVLDYCAGGGGKLLALAARHQARWFAHDAAPQRMKDLPARAARAGIRARIGAPQAHAPYDLVLCDVPCSGSGTWRRGPDAKWRLTPDGLADLTRQQDAILAAAAPLVAPGGMLAYATCSVLVHENETRLAGLEGWRCVLARRWPVSDGGDGFFIAQLIRDYQNLKQS